MKNPVSGTILKAACWTKTPVRGVYADVRITFTAALALLAPLTYSQFAVTAPNKEPGAHRLHAAAHKPLRYFPKGAFGAPHLDAFVSGWYGYELRTMAEPPLYKVPLPEEQAAYRFLWLRTFHHPVCARILLHGTAGTLILKMADGTGGFRPGKLVLNQTIQISEQEVQQFRNLLAALDLWHAPAHSESMGKDGAEWVLEGSEFDRYRVIDRWTPESGPLRELGLYLVLKLGKLNLPSGEIY